LGQRRKENELMRIRKKSPFLDDRHGVDLKCGEEWFLGKEWRLL
jgi:hypothetical protein